ncbi:fluoride efflux transporter CrcB [Diaphorobacter aerolatus]|uniref:Fluoride-specific ion channel FluC n=1 Tax=Diaphorobacter aerolatus TaxID=1288495 RepID=A0A7H0GLW1_9BURK|nr:fluoride efflux transporter CrcB [Diaphorobacter aerolatus]QNP49277.1 fluoride efflux transporter CrcB [Diaphorobacter aerolatus]
MLFQVFAICLGASLGALARWGLGLWLSAGAALPWGTLAANIIGGYLIGICVASFQVIPQLDPAWRLALVTGFLGALTTFSSFSAEVITLLQEQRLAPALAWCAVHLLGSLAMTWLGLQTVALILHTPRT